MSAELPGQVAGTPGDQAPGGVAAPPAVAGEVSSGGQ